MFKIGEIVENVLTHKKLMVIKNGNEQILCRTEDFREVWFYKFELNALSK